MSEGPLKAFLFTDLVGSSAQWDSDSQAMSAALQRHDVLAVRTVADSGGMVFKHSGDGTCAVFDTPDGAVAAAVALQRALADDPVLTLRMGIHFGPAEARDGDWFGATVNRAARMMGLAHGGQVLLSQAAAALFDSSSSDGVSMQRLGSVRLRGLAEPEMVYQVVVDGLAREFPALVGQALNTLPRPRTSFLGREVEIESLCGLLSEERLVTIAGVGGTGKTRLSIEVGRTVLARFADGVLFVALSDVDGEDGVIAAIASNAGVQQGSMLGVSAADPRAALVRALQQREVLVVLDNCEHLLDVVADVVDDILDSCLDVRILVTSRESLSVTGERVWRVPTLDDATALALVLDRARAQNAVFDLSEQDRVVAVEMCRRLDCLPLAIELAAARFATMSVGDVAARLDDRFRLLAGRGRRHDRHATMRATLDWSYDLLDDDERLVLDRLSVFVGGFELEAAERVCGDASMVPANVTDALGSLVDKSLVAAGDRNGHRRFDLLETVRAYAAEHLAARGATEAMRAAHAKWCERFAVATWTARAAGSETDVHDEIDAESDNCRAAHDWATATGTTETALWIASAAVTSWVHRGMAAEGLRRCEAALALSGGSAMARHVCTAAAVQGAAWVFDGEKAWEFALEALATIETSGAPPYLAWIMAIFARSLIDDSSEGPAMREIIEKMRVWATNDAEVARADHFEGNALMRAGNFDEAIPFLERARRSDGEHGWTYLDLMVARWATEPDTAPLGEIRDHIEQTTDPLLATGYQFLESISLAGHGEPVGDAINEILRNARRVGANAGALADGFGSLAAAMGEHHTAAILYGQATHGAMYFFRGRMQPITRSALGDDEYDRLAAVGAAMNDAEYEALAKRLSHPSTD